MFTGIITDIGDVRETEIARAILLGADRHAHMRRRASTCRGLDRLRWSVFDGDRAGRGLV